MKTRLDHEQLFDEICSKLHELSRKDDSMNPERLNERLERMQQQMKKSQEELRSAHQIIEDKIKTLDEFTSAQSDCGTELKKMAEQLDQERTNGARMSADLARSLELNLKLQIEIEEVRAKANQVLNEEKRHNQYLQEKNQKLAQELELSQAMVNDARLELGKAKERLVEETEKWRLERVGIEEKMTEREKTTGEHLAKMQEITESLQMAEEENRQLVDAVTRFEAHVQEQNAAMRTLSEVAEKKIVELKMGMDRKGTEAQDYYSHLQQALGQAAVLKQENTALRDYTSKLAALYNQAKAQLHMTDAGPSPVAAPPSPTPSA